MVKVGEDVSELKIAVTQLLADNKETKVLANDNAQYSRRESIRIHGLVPYKKGENSKVRYMVGYMEKRFL